MILKRLVCHEMIGGSVKCLWVLLGVDGVDRGYWGVLPVVGVEVMLCQGVIRVGVCAGPECFCFLVKMLWVYSSVLVVGSGRGWVRVFLVGCIVVVVKGVV